MAACAGWGAKVSLAISGAAASIGTTERPMAKVLLVDDMLSIRALLKVYLLEFKFEFLEAGDGAQGLAIAQIQRPDLVIVDLQMPLMDGAEFLERLRKEPTIARTPVVVLSGDQAAVAAIAQKTGFDTLVATKPIDPVGLKRVVRQALKMPV